VSKTILVTGGAGAIGSTLVNKLAELGHRVIILDNLSSGHVENIRQAPNIQFIQGDIASDEDLNWAFSYPVRVVFHLAANFANQNSVDFPQRDLMVNGMGTLKLLLRVQEYHVERFVYSSSSCVYGNRDEPLSEKCREYSLDTPYGITKLLGERYVNFFHYHHKLPMVILRYFNVYGPSEYPGKYRNAMANFFYKAMRNEEIAITGTGEETRDFNYVEDTVRGTILASEKEDAIGKTFNIASGHETKIKDVVKKIIQITGSKSVVSYRERRDWDSVTRRVAAIDEAKEVLSYAPKISLDEGLAKYYEWLRKQDLKKCEW